MTTQSPNLCLACQHYEYRDPAGVYFIDGQFQPGDGRPVCKAFPEGVPTWALMGGDHRSPVEGDNGIVFTPKAGSENIVSAWFMRWSQTNGQ